MDCDKFAEMLDSYASLSADEMCKLEDHARECEKCADELEFMRSILSTVGSLPPIEPPEDFLDRLNARLNKEIQTPLLQRVMRRTVPFAKKYGAMAACVALALAIGTNADRLVSQMRGGDGVISSYVTVSGTDSTEAVPTVQPEPTAVVQEPAAAEAAQTPSADTTAVPKITAVSEKSTPKPAAKNDASPRPEPQKTLMPTAEPSDSPAPSVTEAPETVPAIADTENDADTSISSRARMSEPEVHAEPIRIAPNVKPEQITDTPPIYRIASINDEPSYADASESAAASADDYSMATAIPQSETASVAPLSSTVIIHSDDAARVHEIVAVFVNGVYGNYYMITSKDMQTMLAQLDREGIWYNANINDSGDKVSFKLIIV